jgi:hypothetical protein
MIKMINVPLMRRIGLDEQVDPARRTDNHEMFVKSQESALKELDEHISLGWQILHPPVEVEINSGTVLVYSIRLGNSSLLELENVAAMKDHLKRETARLAEGAQ